MKRVVSVWLPTWPTDRLRIINSAPARDVPFATVGREGTRRVLASVDACAAGMGLCAGQTLAYARALVPGLDVAEADEAGDVEGLRRIGREFLRRYSPVVALEGAEIVWIDVTGCAHLFGGEDGLVGDVLKYFGERRIAARVALADTFGCAFAVARCARKNGVIVPQGKQREWLARVPVGALRVDREVVAGLARLGFVRIAQLLETPRAPIVRRFGKALMARLDEALGWAAEVLEPLSLPEAVEEKCSFVEPVGNPEFLAEAVGKVAERLCLLMEAKGLGARKVDLLFQRVDNAVQGIRIGTVSASRDARHLMRLFREKFDTVDCGFGIEAVVLRAVVVEPLGAAQIGNVLAEKEKRDLSGLIDVLHSRLGSGNVFQAAAVESDVPERSFKRVAALSRKTFAGWPDALPRPARVLRRPEKVEAMALLPDHAPVRFVWRRRPYRVARADGPERIFGEWWKDHAEVMAVRDYFQVEDEKGERFWLFRRGDGDDPRTGSQEWFLHGFFG